VAIIYDPKKNERNIAKHGLSFDRVADFDFSTAVRSIDTRKEYGEVRVIAVGYLDGRLHSLCFVEIDDDTRVISFRKANDREVRKYAKAQTTDQR
jgi:uncharacterized DUF497 family protein